MRLKKLRMNFPVGLCNILIEEFIMSKYVCDFDKVTEVGNNLCDLSESLKENITNYKNNVGNAVSTWQGSTKNSFDSVSEKQESYANDSADCINKLGKLIKNISITIQNVEDDLSSFKL